ncbi:hypothetical protein F4819DRAFT_443804 [Hypoxylon fuscum]|nr:hypothetical protein F4819DRAFT_443804 [Hypoxylon fuscum]
MIKSGVSLLLLWSLCSTGSIGVSGTAPKIFASDSKVQKDTREGPTVRRWTTTQRDGDGESLELRYQLVAPDSTTETPLLTTTTSPESFRFRNRQATEEDIDADNDGDDNDKAPPPPPPPPPEVVAAAIAGVSNSVSASVSGSVALSVTSVFSTSLAALSASATSAIQSAREAGRAEGASSATAGAGVTTTTTETQVTSPRETSSAPPVLSTTTEDAGAIASIQASASRAIEAAKASASSSIQNAMDAAVASARAEVANVNSSSDQGSSLTPGQIGGIVISIAFISALLSALATYLFMRQRQRQQETQSNFESDLPHESRDQGPVDPPLTSETSFQMFMASSAMSHNLSPTFNNNFIPDVKRKLPPPPDTKHPAMSYSARPLSMPGPDGQDPIFPISPLGSEADSVAIVGGSKPPAAHRRPSMDADRRREAAASVRLSLARQQSISGGQRAQLVRVGSNSSQKAKDSPASPLALNPVRAKTEFRLFPNTKDVATTPTEPRHIAMFLQPQSPAKDDRYATRRTIVPSPTPPAQRSVYSPVQVQAPIPRRPVDPFSLESGTMR